MKDLIVSASPHPFKADNQYLEISSGKSIAEIVEFAQPHPVLRQHVVVFVDDEKISEDQWEVVPDAGQFVTISIVPSGDLEDVFRTVVGLAVVAGAAFLGPIAAGALGITSAFGVALVTGAIATVGFMVVNAIAPIRPPSIGPRGAFLAEESPSFFLDAARNTARLYAPVPVIFGKHRVVPPLAAQTVTEVVGDDHHLRMLVCWGYGPLKVREIKIGDTPITDFSDVRIETREGRSTDSDITIYPDQISQSNFTTLLDTDAGWVVRRSRTGADELSVDLTLPRGLAQINRGGKRVDYTVAVDLQYRKVGATTWTRPGSFTNTVDFTRTSENYLQFTDARTQPIRIGLRWNTGERAQYDVRLRRRSDDDQEEPTGDNTDEESILSQYSQVYWSNLRTITDKPPFDFPEDLSVTAIDIRANEQLSGVVDTLNGIVEAEYLDWNGSAWVNRATRNPASAFRAALQHPGRREAASNSEINLTALQNWHSFCSTNGYHFDAIHDRTTSLWNLLSDIAATGRASPAYRDGKWTVVWDSGSQVVKQHFTERNSRNFSMSRSYSPPPHGLKMSFHNEEQNWNRDERIVYDDTHNDSNATIVPTVSPVGITDPEHIYRFARFQLAQTLLRREVWSLEAPFEYLVANRGDRVSVSHPALKVGIATARVTKVTTNSASRVTSVDIDPAIALPAPESASSGFSAKIRTVGDANIVARITNGQSATPHSTLTFSTPLSSSKSVEVGSLLTVGDTGSEKIDGLISAIEPSDDLTARLSIVPFQQGIYNAETGAIPAFVSGIAGSTTIDLTLVIENIISDESVIRAVGGVQFYGIKVEVLPIRIANAEIDCEIRPHGADGQYSPAEVRTRSKEHVEIGGVQSGEGYDLRLRWRTPSKTGPWTYQENHVVQGNRPERPTILTVSETTNRTRKFEVGLPADPAIAGFHIRFSSSVNDEWEDLVHLHSGTLTASPVYAFDPGAGRHVVEARTVNADGEFSTTGRRIQHTFGGLPAAGGFTWRGAWASGTEYNANDAVAYQGRSYLALSAHTASTSNAPSGTDAANATWGILAARGSDGLAGIDGVPGADGTGVEWIFAVNNSLTLPANQRPSNDWGFDEGGTTTGGLEWHDAGPSVSSSTPYLWACIRKTEGFPSTGDSVDGNWDEPFIISRWVAAGSVGPAGIAGADGDDGEGIELIFARTTGSRPSLPSNSWGYDQISSSVWSDAAPNLTQTIDTLWMCSRRTEGMPRQGDAVSDNWTSPAIVGRWGPQGIRGPAGQDGRDGTDGVAGPAGPRVWQKLVTSSRSIGRSYVGRTWSGGFTSTSYDAFALEVDYSVSGNRFSHFNGRYSFYLIFSMRGGGTEVQRVWPLDSADTHVVYVTPVSGSRRINVKWAGVGSGISVRSIWGIRNV